MQLSIANLFAFGMSFLSVPVIARCLGPVGRGESAGVVASYLIAPVVVGLGLLEFPTICAFLVVALVSLSDMRKENVCAL